ncbi:MAG: beta-ketoacyl synthase chain length factor [Halofilum sp. (in: g-proteobacteria)]
MRCQIEGVGIVAPGLPDWSSARPCLAGDSIWQPGALGRVVAPDLPRTEARRATQVVHLSMTAAAQAMAAAEPPDTAMPSVWSSADGDLIGLERTCLALAEDPPWASPHRFQNSVHNTPAGYWSIATGCRGPSTALAGGGDSFVAGLVEAMTLLTADGAERCLLVVYDEASPPTLERVRPVAESFATALLLRADGNVGTPLELRKAPASATPTACEDAGLERLRATNPAARALPLLCALAAGRAQTLVLPWNDTAYELQLGESA